MGYIIGLAGKAGAGKDVIGNYLVSKMDRDIPDFKREA